MADLVLSPALQVIFDRLASPILQKVADMWELKDNLQSLREALMLIQPTLEDAEEQQFTNKAVRLWLSKLKIAAYDAEDGLDYLTAKGMIRSSIYKFPFEELMSATKDRTNATQISTMLQELEKTVTEGLLKFNVKAGPASMIDRRSAIRETSSFVIQSEIYGRDDEKDKLVQLLLSSDEASQEGYATCIPIIGIGGIGKTTLTQLAYNDKRVIQHFDVRMWIYVSDDFSVKKIMKAIIEYVTKEKCRFLEIELLQSQLWHLLHNKRYLLVLDDVWTANQNDWDKLKPLFRSGVDGCKIIVTTRNKQTACMTDSPYCPFYLKGLQEEDCWTLFKQRAFGRGEADKYPQLLLIGKQIVKKCGGVPLAAKSLGSLMRFKREQQQWLFMQNTQLWRLDVDVLPALMLSYLYLPLHLRQCFAFCSIFPKKYEFKKDKLIYLWMAEGLIPQEESKRPEDIGDEYFADLVRMSFLEEVQLCDEGGLIGYKMNDVIHDLAQYVAREESLILEHDHSQQAGLRDSKIRHLSVVYKNSETAIPIDEYQAQHLRTLVLIGEFGLLRQKDSMLLGCIYLRVLDLNSCDVSDLPDALDHLICLRYLDLSYTPISRLPSSTSSLSSLQTLNLFGCRKLKWLPSFGNLVNVRHLNFTGCESLSVMPLGIESLFQLQKLPLYVFSKYNGALSKLQHLNLYGKLNITNLWKARFADEVQSAVLNTKENLESLGLYWGAEDWGTEDWNYSFIRSVTKAPAEKAVISASYVHGVLVEEVLERLEPHRNLKRLVVNGYPGITFPNWTLPNLIAVNLTNCKNFEHLPALGNLVLLKTLCLRGMDGVNHIGAEFYGDGRDEWFSSLEELSLCDFPNLEEWSTTNNENSFRRLRKFTVNRCPKLAHIPLPPSLQYLQLRDCNLTLRAVANLDLLAVLLIESVPEVSSLPEGLFASAHLSCLKILSCPKLRSLPLEMGNCLTSLKSLTIGWCQDLTSLPESLQNLKAPESLEIRDCHYIISMPDGAIGGLSSLRTLSIENCTSLTSLSSSLEQLTLLEHLTIMYCPSFGSFPEGVQHLSALRSLTILSCPWFDSLPNGLQNVRTLHCLEISSCTNLTALPEWFENLDSLRSLTISACPNLEALPAGQKHLTKLQHLSIQECPQLEERCRQGSGEDWFKIAHVPHKYIGSPRVSQSSKASTSGSSSSQTSAQ